MELRINRVRINRARPVPQINHHESTIANHTTHRKSVTSITLNQLKQISHYKFTTMIHYNLPQINHHKSTTTNCCRSSQINHPKINHYNSPQLSHHNHHDSYVPRNSQQYSFFKSERMIVLFQTTRTSA